MKPGFFSFLARFSRNTSGKQGAESQSAAVRYAMPRQCVFLFPEVFASSFLPWKTHRVPARQRPRETARPTQSVARQPQLSSSPRHQSCSRVVSVSPLGERGHHLQKKAPLGPGTMYKSQRRALREFRTPQELAYQQRWRGRPANLLLLSGGSSNKNPTAQGVARSKPPYDRDTCLPATISRVPPLRTYFWNCQPS